MRGKPAADASRVKPMSAEAVEATTAADAYDSPPWWYDLRGFAILTLAYQTTLWSQVSFFARNIRARHLELAIGTGTLFRLVLWLRRLLRRPAAEICGIDYSPRMLAGPSARLEGRPGCR
jgi:ubiquinone/menaquinone biosynthesis C-methylase UbiE